MPAVYCNKHIAIYDMYIYIYICSMQLTICHEAKLCRKTCVIIIEYKKTMFNLHKFNKVIIVTSRIKT